MGCHDDWVNLPVVLQLGLFDGAEASLQWLYTNFILILLWCNFAARIYYISEHIILSASHAKCFSNIMSAIIEVIGDIIFHKSYLDFLSRNIATLIQHQCQRWCGSFQTGAFSPSWTSFSWNTYVPAWNKETILRRSWRSKRKLVRSWINVNDRFTNHHRNTFCFTDYHTCTENMFTSSCGKPLILKYSQFGQKFCIQLQLQPQLSSAAKVNRRSNS